MPDDVKSADGSQGHSDSETEAEEVFERQKDELSLARDMVTASTRRIREALMKDPSTRVFAEIRAARDRLRKNLVRLAAATDAVVMSRRIEGEEKAAQKEQERVLEVMVEDIEFDLELYLREHDREAFDEGGSVHSNSIQHQKLPEPKLNSTVIASPGPKTSWKELLQRIPVFKGDPTKFKRWRDAFVLHVDSSSMDPLEKFELMLKVVDDKVTKCIASLDVSADNYERAKEAIFEKYGDVCMAEDHHVDNLMEACRRKDLHDNRSFVNFVTDVTQSVESLVALGNTFKGMSVFPARLILKALPYDRKRRFDDAYAMQDETVKECRLKALLDFLKAEQKQVGRLTLVYRNSEERQEQSAGKKNRFDKFTARKANHSKFEKSRYNPAGPTGSVSNQHAFAVAASSSQVDHSCIFCSENHSSAKCKKKMSPEERRKCTVTTRACYKCLNRNHLAKNCKRKGCAKCQEAHHELLCERSTGTTVSAVAVIPEKEDASVNSIKITDVTEKRLPTGYVLVMSDDRESIGRIVLDTGSQKTLVSESFANKVKAKQVGSETFFLHSAGQATPKRCKGRIVEITVKSRFSDNHIVIRATALPNVVEGRLPESEYKGNLHPIADRNEGQWSTDINILVGVDYLYPIIGQTIKKIGGFIAIETLFGFFLCGTGQHQEVKVNPALVEVIQKKRENWIDSGSRSRAKETVSLVASIKSKYGAEDISFLWDTEIMGIEPYFKDSDEAPNEELRKFFRETTRRKPDGRYVIHLPIKPNIDTLGDNRELTMKRLKSFLFQSRKNRELLEAVDAEIEDLREKGFIELAEAPKDGERAHYLPLLAVIKKPATAESKMVIRIVNDASARSPHLACINDILYQGENLIADVVEVILKFRQLKIAITADIERAYLQFEIVPEHRNLLRFLWPVGISKDPRAPIREMRSCRLSFGLVSSAFLHCAGVILHLENEIERNPGHAELLNFVKNNFYVDDLIAGATSADEGKLVVKTLYETFQAGCFPLKKWSTNSAELGRFIRDSYPEATVTFEDENFKFLGIRWNQRKDSLHIGTTKTIAFFDSCSPSKRSLLKGVSQVFDPIGLVAPITLGLKKLLQKYWIKKISWDSNLEGEDLEEFKDVIGRLENIEKISVPRNFLGDKGVKETAVRELHIFCDASLTGYGCVAYARDVTENNNVSVTFIMAKGRVAPLKGDWSIHRLELLGAVVAVRIAKRITQAVEIPFASVNFWCDNASVLGWIRDKPERWKSFVENRIKEIQANSDASQWRYIRSAENSADLLSRSSALDSAEIRDFWIHGPKWLRSADKPEDHKLNPSESEWEVANEKKAQCFVGISVIETEPIGIKKLSSWSKTVRIVAYIKRWRRFKRNLKPQWLSGISANEYGDAEIALLKNVQRQHFSAEIATGCKDISKQSQLYQYNPFLDKDGLIRCRSRLSNLKNVDFETVNPIILPGEDEMVELYVRWTHEEICRHAGSVMGVLQRLRRRFLVLRARRVASKAINRCKTCVKFRARTASEPVPHLPNFRVETAAAFSTTGVDAAGPITVRSSDGKKSLAYIMLFCCSVSRAIRMELVENLSTYEFLLAMRRFYNRNPMVSCFFSDNAASFRRAAKEVKILFDLARSDQTQSFLSKHRMEWKFNTERAPWRNGFVERCFRTIKEPLRKIVGKNIVPFRELETILTDIEKIVNDRPLTYLGTNPDEILPLRPSDLMYGNQVRPALPEMKEIIEKSNDATAVVFSDRWKHQQKVLNAFWSRFRKEYLLQLRSNLASKPAQSRPIGVGDVVLIDDAAASRSYWPMARVLSLSGAEGSSECSDNRKRTCVIKLTNGKTLRRPIQLLYKLDLAEY